MNVIQTCSHMRASIWPEATSTPDLSDLNITETALNEFHWHGWWALRVRGNISIMNCNLCYLCNLCQVKFWNFCLNSCSDCQTSCLLQMCVITVMTGIHKQPQGLSACRCRLRFRIFSSVYMVLFHLLGFPIWSRWLTTGTCIVQQHSQKQSPALTLHSLP